MQIPKNLWILAVFCLAFNTAAESRYTEPFPSAASKKGLQVEIVEDALTLGVKHAALNLNITALADLFGDTNNPSFKFEGHEFHFNRGPLEGADRQVKALSEHGVVVYMIVLAYASANPEINKLVLHPKYDPTTPNHLGAFNTVTDEGRLWYRALLDFLAERWSRPDKRYGRVCGYIIGNEVNSHWFWSNMGKVRMEEFADNYLQAVRLAHDSIRRESSWARVYLSMEHHWNIHYPGGDELMTFAGRPFLEYFAKRARERGDFDWNLAFHPYPENFFEPRFWNDKSATTNRDTPRITFKNLSMLTDYMREPAMLFEGKPRHIVLSEQGFHTPNMADGETIQAAAYCYAYKKVNANPEIEAFILHRHVDNDNEGGLMLGLRKNKPAHGEDRPRKKIYDCFRLADTPDWRSAFDFALPVIGLKTWDEAK